MAAGGYVKRNIWDEATYLGYPLTPWYPPSVKPVRKGLYIVGSDKLSVMSEWNGKQWISGNGKPMWGQCCCWRGIAGEPK